MLSDEGDAGAMVVTTRAVLSHESPAMIERSDWMAAYSSIASACNAGRASVIFDMLKRELAGNVERRLAPLSAPELSDMARLSKYDAEYTQYTRSLRTLHDVYGYLNRTWASTHGQQGIAPLRGVHDTTSLGLLIWRERLVEPLTPLLQGAMTSLIETDRAARGPSSDRSSLPMPPSTFRLALLGDVLAAINALGVACDAAAEPRPVREFAPRSVLAVGKYGDGAGLTNAAVAADDDDEDDEAAAALLGASDGESAEGDGALEGSDDEDEYSDEEVEEDAYDNNVEEEDGAGLTYGFGVGRGGAFSAGDGGDDSFSDDDGSESTSRSLATPHGVNAPSAVGFGGGTDAGGVSSVSSSLPFVAFFTSSTSSSAAAVGAPSGANNPPTHGGGALLCDPIGWRVVRLVRSGGGGGAARLAGGDAEAAPQHVARVGALRLLRGRASRAHDALRRRATAYLHARSARPTSVGSPRRCKPRGRGQRPFRCAARGGACSRH